MSYKIKKDGLIWKLHEEFNSEVYNKLCDDTPVGLCLFFWNTLLQIIKAVGALAFVIIMCGILVAVAAFLLNWSIALISAAFGYILPFVNYELGLLQTLLVLVISIGFIVVELFLKAIGSDSAQMKVVPSYLTNLLPEKKEVVKDKPQGLVVSYWKAFKGKVCPLIQVEE